MKKPNLIHKIYHNPLFYLAFLMLAIPSRSLHAQELSYANPTEYEIGGISVSGTQFLDQNVLVTISGLKRGDKIDIPGHEISKAIENLWNQRLFTDVQIDLVDVRDGKAYLDIRVVERPRLGPHYYSGIGRNEADELDKKLGTSLRMGSIITENLKVTTSNTIRDFYIDKGFLDAQVSILEHADSNLANTNQLEILVNRGKRVKIDQIEIVGNQVFPDARIEGKMKDTKERVKIDKQLLKLKANGAFGEKGNAFSKIGRLSLSRSWHYLDEYINWNIFKPSKFSRENLESDQKRVIEFYNTKGYRDAQWTSDTISHTANGLKLKLTLTEGNQYYFRNIYWKGNSRYSSDTLSKVLSIKKGEVYNKQRLEQQLSFSPSGLDVSSLYMNYGYLFFSATPVELSIENDSVDLEMRLYEGPRAVVNQIIITGNTKTNENVIRRELYVKPGDVFSREDLVRSNRQLAALGFFDPEQIEMNPVPNPTNGTVDIIFKVVEKPNDQLELSAGASGRGIFGTLGIGFNNFSIQRIFKKGGWSPLPSGDGQKLNLRFQSNGKQYQSGSFSFTEPWLGGKKPINFSVSLFYNNYNRTDTFLNDKSKVRDEIIGSFRIFGSSLEIGSRLKKPDDYFQIFPSINYQRYMLNNYSLSDFSYTDGSSNNLYGKISLERNSLDFRRSNIYPTGGSSLSVSAQATLPYSYLFKGRMLDYADDEMTDDVRYKMLEYYKFRINADWYQSLTRDNKLVVHTVAKFGFMGAYNQELGLSPFERFEVGGDGLSNFTGYTGKDIIALRGYDVLNSGNSSPIFNKFTLELRYPFSFNPNATVYGMLFAEGANYYNSFKTYNPLDLKRSVGLGMRINLPMFGLLGFDYGLGFDKSAAETAGAKNIFAKYGRFRVILGFEPE